MYLDVCNTLEMHVWGQDTSAKRAIQHPMLSIHPQSLKHSICPGMIEAVQHSNDFRTVDSDIASERYIVTQEALK